MSEINIHWPTEEEVAAYKEHMSVVAKGIARALGLDDSNARYEYNEEGNLELCIAKFVDENQIKRFKNRLFELIEDENLPIVIEDDEVIEPICDTENPEVCESCQ